MLGLSVQLGLVLLIAWEFQLENRTFFAVLVLASGGSLVSAALPLAWRLPFFVGLSLAGIFWSFGVAQGGLLVGTGLALIGICHLPVRWSIRIALLLAAGALLATARARVVPGPISPLVWPILGSMFMFRLALYVYALRYEKLQVSATTALAYFFMLPNIAFPLFPVVDYTTFARTHYDQDAFRIYETGVRWIVRGLLQLLLYRYVYVTMSLDPASLTGLGNLLGLVIGTFLLYLRVSGSFHLVIGLLHLFGFRLPETHHLYVLAPSFTDFWRRINIYWKDFMMKLVYYPSFFRLRGRGTPVAVVGATIVVFFVTWILHSYQWFWLRGGFPLTAQDGLFWGVLGVLVVINAQRELKRGRGRAEGKQRWSLGLGLRTVGTFSVICVLWSLWSAESVVEWLFMWRFALRADLADLALLAALLAGGVALSGYGWGSWGIARGRPARPPFLLQPAVRATVLLLLVHGLAQTELYAGAAPGLAGTMASLRTPVLNARDEELQHRGYYEKLDNPGRMSAQLWNTVGVQPQDWQGPVEIGLLRSHASFLGSDLHPNLRTTLNGVPLTTNAWGMRDREYPREKPPGTVRIALLGQSHVLGTFVADDETFENVLEDRLNREQVTRRYQILNFAVTNHSLLQELALLEDRVLDFEPDIVIVTIPSQGRFRSAEHLVRTLDAHVALPYDDLRPLLERGGLLADMQTGIPLPFTALRSLAAVVGLDTRMPFNEALARARDISPDLTEWALRRIAAAVTERGARPVLLGLTNVMDPPRGEIPDLAMARAAGFLVLDLFDVYQQEPHELLQIAPWDRHPNPRGHQVIADRLYHELQRHRVRLGLTLDNVD
jgi:D-alanyl-lipoteichoic acid acyltransferase DltB (MBOAT superfamily)/lysophospholipase L1-like esterase